jgi:hypothetical protein
MSETPDQSTDATAPLDTEVPVAAPAPPAERRPNRLNQVAAWVAIVAGTLVILAVVFFSGFILGRHADGGPQHHRHHGHHMMFDRGGPMGPPPMPPGMHPGGPSGPGEGHRWPGPGNFGPGGPGGPGAPERPTQTQAPTPTR